jgi:hypothetical protein
MSSSIFLWSALPSLQLKSAPELSFDELIYLFKMNLLSSELEQVEVIRRYIDLKNVKHLLLHEPIDLRGNFTEKELDEALISREGLPVYLFDFLDEYESEEEQASHFSKVLMQFFRDPEQRKGRFLEQYLDFERRWRLSLTGFRAKNFSVSLAEELQDEDQSDLFVAEIVAQEGGGYFEFPFEYKGLGESLKAVEKSPMKHYDLMAEFRFYWVEEQMQGKPFSLDYILGYLVQFLIVEDGCLLQEKRGGELLDKLMQDVG